jgi:hypothetical protein
MVQESWASIKAKKNRMKYASAQPYTAAERDRDDQARLRSLETIHNRRKATPSGQNYNIPGDKASKDKAERIMGEREGS